MVFLPLGFQIEVELHLISVEVRCDLHVLFDPCNHPQESQAAYEP